MEREPIGMRRDAALRRGISRRLARGTRQMAAAALFAAVLTALAGCANAAGSAAPRASATSSSAASAARTIPHDAVPSATVATQVAVTQRATAAMRAFCQPDRSAAAWTAGLDPFLTLSAAGVYGTVDPARVPCIRVTGTARLGAGDAFTRLVVVPTDAGRYRVTLSRSSTAAPWMVSQLVPVDVAR